MLVDTLSKMGKIIAMQTEQDLSMQLSEEMGELLQALGKYYRATGNGQPLGQHLSPNDAKAAIAEEIADVEVCLDELKLKLNLNQGFIGTVYNQKVYRAYDRILKQKEMV